MLIIRYLYNVAGCVIVGSVDGNRIWGKELRGQQLAHVVVSFQRSNQSNPLSQVNDNASVIVLALQLRDTTFH